MDPLVLASLFGVGIAVGILSGLIGIGGGVLIVPFLYFFYAHGGWSGVELAPSLHATVAHATSLFVIVPTALRGTLTYHRSSLVAWRAALPIAIAATISAVAGARLALLLPAEVLKAAFGLLLIVSGSRLLRRPPPAAARQQLRLDLAVTALTGLAVGLLSALLGVGGGLVAIPLLVYVIGLDLHRVAATSLAIVAFAATSGFVTYALSGWGAPGLPPWSLGYVHVAAGVPILVGSLVSVRWGAMANQRLSTGVLRRVFAVVFVLFGLRLIAENAGSLIR